MDQNHRAICFIRWPNGGFGQPRTVAHPSHITDILPTFIDLCGLKRSQETSFDGVSLQPVLRNEDASPDDRMIIVQYGSRQQPSAYFSCVVWNDWRLVGENELYDLSVDPGQEKNVADQHPDIAARMKAHYDKFWAEVAPSVEIIEPHVVGSPHAPAIVLTSANWLEVDVDNQDRVANAAGPARGGVWHIEAQQSGRYKVELSRWPFHLERGLTEQGPAETIGGTPIDPGQALPIDKAVLSINGQAPIAAMPSASGTTVELEIELNKGQSTLQGWFQDAAGNDLRGAYYGRVTKL